MGYQTQNLYNKCRGYYCTHTLQWLWNECGKWCYKIDDLLQVFLFFIEMN